MRFKQQFMTLSDVGKDKVDFLCFQDDAPQPFATLHARLQTRQIYK